VVLLLNTCLLSPAPMQSPERYEVHGLLPSQPHLPGVPSQVRETAPSH